MFSTDNPTQCSAHFVNDGVIVVGSDVIVEFEGTGTDEFLLNADFECSVDDGNYEACKENDYQLHAIV